MWLNNFLALLVGDQSVLKPVFADRFQFTTGPLVRGLYSPSLTGLVVNVSETTPDGSTAVGRTRILLENQLLGMPRLRLLRVRNDSCVVHMDFHSLISACYNVYAEDSEDRSTFGPANSTA